MTTISNFFLDPEQAHALAKLALRVARVEPFKSLLKSYAVIQNPRFEKEIFGITFPNLVGLGAGFDKNAMLIEGLEAFGFGFIEIGTITRHAQLGNPKPRLFRNDAERIITNRMGFNNIGADAVAKVLQRSKHTVPIGISLGKSKITKLEDAAEEYLYSFKVLYDLGDYFVINVSSPNTPGLRTLQEKDALTHIVSLLAHYRSLQRIRKPLLIKVAPDLGHAALDEVLSIIETHVLDGIVATNTLSTPEGGQSGMVLQKRATEIIRYLHSRAPTLPIIGVGGIFTAKDVQQKLDAGASLVQVYTGLIYEGPFIVRKLLKAL
jgi:dihydroorotate dehydrogenase